MFTAPVFAGFQCAPIATHLLVKERRTNIERLDVSPQEIH
jgi:hypothetical protein